MELIKVRGRPMYVHDNEALSNHIKREGDYFEAEILDFMVKNFPFQETILDIGANIGNHSLFFARYFETWKEIYAFEPLQENFEILDINMNFLEPTWNVNQAHVFLYGLSNEKRLVHFTPNHSNMGAGEISSEGEIEIMVIPLDYLAIKNVSLMKIDVEWHEPQVLEGAKETIARDKPLILIEDSLERYPALMDSYDYHALYTWPQHRTYLYGPKNP